MNDYTRRRALTDERATAETKVFWFFFSKKNRFLTQTA